MPDRPARGAHARPARPHRRAPPVARPVLGATLARAVREAGTEMPGRVAGPVGPGLPLNHG